MDIFDQLAQENDQKKFEPTINKTPENINEENSGDIFDQVKKENEEVKKNEFGFLATLKDVGEQAITKGIAGVGGAYGNILDTFGLQTKEGQSIPKDEGVEAIQTEAINKTNRGEVPSYGEIMLQEDFNPSPIARFPTSKEIQKGIEGITGIGEGKTPTGRIAGRGTEFLGEGVALGGGGKALSVLGGSGLLGQGSREIGAPEFVSSGIEIAAPLLQGSISGKLAPSKGVKTTVEAGRKIGLSEKQIAPLIQGEAKTAILSKIARKGTKTKERFAGIKESLGDSYNKIKLAPEAKIKLPNIEQISLRKEFGGIRNELTKTLAPSPEKEAAIKYVEEALNTLRNVDVTPEHLVNFWQDINKSVNWNSISGGKKALAQLKEPVSKVLKKVSPSLAEDFEMTNQLYSKYAQISKKLKPDLVDSFVNKGEIIAGFPAGLAIAQGNPYPLLALGGEVATRLMAREMLINPYFQNMAKKLVTNFNSASTKGVQELVTHVKDYMKRKHPNENWDFLNSSFED